MQHFGIILIKDVRSHFYQNCYMYYSYTFYVNAVFTNITIDHSVIFCNHLMADPTWIGYHKREGGEG